MRIENPMPEIAARLMEALRRSEPTLLVGDEAFDVGVTHYSGSDSKLTLTVEVWGVRANKA